MEKRDYKSISIAISSELLKKLDEGKFNKSKLIDSLLTDYFKDYSNGEYNALKKKC